MTYRIAEVYAGLEGEGHGPGVPTIRVRLQGCNQPCKLRQLCDEPAALNPTEGTTMTLDELIEAVKQFDMLDAVPCRWVSLTGGEPLEQPIEPVIAALHAAGKLVRVETSGMARRLEVPVDYLRVSPKELHPRRTVQDYGTELSLVYTGREKLSEWEQWGLFEFRTLQPLWQADGSHNAADVIQLCQENPTWSASFQVHKYVGLK